MPRAVAGRGSRAQACANQVSIGQIVPVEDASDLRHPFQLVLTPGQAQEVHGFPPYLSCLSVLRAMRPWKRLTGQDPLSVCPRSILVSPWIRLLGGQLPFQGFEANREGLQVVRPGHSQPLQCLLDSLVDGGTDRLAGCLAFLLHSGLDDPQLDEGMVDSTINLGLEFLTGLLGPPGELGLKFLRILFRKLGPAPDLGSKLFRFFPRQACQAKTDEDSLFEYVEHGFPFRMMKADRLGQFSCGQLRSGPEAIKKAPWDVRGSHGRGCHSQIKKPSGTCQVPKGIHSRMGRARLEHIQ